MSAPKTIPICDEHHRILKLMVAHDRGTSMTAIVSAAVDMYIDTLHPDMRAYYKRMQSRSTSLDLEL